MMNDKARAVYSEVYAFLNIISQEDRNKVPSKLREMIEEERKKEYTPSYTLDSPIDKQEISDEAIAMIALIHLNYWCKDKNEKESLSKIFEENEKKYQENLREKYNPDNLFKKYNNTKNQECKNQKIIQETALVEYKDNFFIKFKNFILKLLHIG